MDGRNATGGRGQEPVSLIDSPINPFHPVRVINLSLSRFVRRVHQATNDTEVFSETPPNAYKNRHIFTFNVCKWVLSACAGTAP